MLDSMDVYRSYMKSVMCIMHNMPVKIMYSAHTYSVKIMYSVPTHPCLETVKIISIAMGYESISVFVLIQGESPHHGDAFDYITNWLHFLDNFS